MKDQPWASGPGEVLRHGLALLKDDSDTNRRLAMISIDNAVELMLRTFLGLPRRVTGLGISRREFQEISESFPALLDALEKYAPDRLDGVDLGAIEWYHRLRNQLYHQGNGLTVERDKVEIYAELANSLFRNLFGQSLVEQPRKTELLGQFMMAWGLVERSLRDLAQQELADSGDSSRMFLSMIDTFHTLHAAGKISDEDIQTLNSLRSVRNMAVHGGPDWEMLLTPERVAEVRSWAERFQQRPAAQREDAADEGAST